MRNTYFGKPITLCSAVLFAFSMMNVGQAANLQSGTPNLAGFKGSDVAQTMIDLVPVQLNTQNSEVDIHGAFVGVHGLSLPGTFTGTLPCADCEGILHHLDLWPDGTYHMRRTWLGGDDNNQRDEIGRWYADPGRQAIVLNGASEMPLQWQILGEDRLRQLAMDGTSIESTLNYELTNEGGLAATDLEGIFLAGMAWLSPGAATFEECLTGRIYDISEDGARDDLVGAFETASGASDDPLFARVEAMLHMQGADLMGGGAEIVISRLIETAPGRECDPLPEQAALTDTYWRIDGILDEAVIKSPDIREPYLVLLSDEGGRYTASVGCNQISGRYETVNEAISFGPAMKTRMACPPELDALERRLQEVLLRARGYRHENTTLTFVDEAGQTLADLAAVAFR